MATNYASLPAAWSNKKKVERLTTGAYDSLTRMLSRAVAETNTNFSIWSALRTKADQIKLFKENYTPAGRGRQLSTDRSYQGKIWKRKPGGVSVASPDLGSNHQDGEAVDIHPAAIQEWIKRNGMRFGWSWDEGKRVGENWHFRYIAAKDQYKAEGRLDHAAVQRAVGAAVDGKIGTDTVAKIKTFQKSKGLDVDGKVGPATKAALGLSGKGDAAPVTPTVSAGGTSAPAAKAATAQPGAWIPRSEWLGKPKNSVVLAENPDRVQTEIYIHYPGTAGILAGESQAQTRTRLLGYYNAHVGGEYTDIAYNVAVDQSGRVWELRGIDRQSGANGGTASNRRGQSVLVLVGNDEAPTAQALAGVEDAIKRIRAVHPKATKVLGHQQSPDASTACPGASLMALIRAGSIGTGTPAAAPAAPAKSSPAKLVEDGRWGTSTTAALQRLLGVKVDGRTGPDTWKALQRRLGHPVVDGLIEHQSYKPDELGNGISPNGWRYTGRKSKGSKTIRRLQSKVGVTADGVVYEGTTRAVQKALNTGRL